MHEHSKPKERAIDEGLFSWPAAAPALRASRCKECQAFAFPASDSCMSCGGGSVDVVDLPRRGTLWTWTIQRFMPKPPFRSDERPEAFTPFGIGYVELPGALRIETRLMENDPSLLRIGCEMELVFYRHCSDPDGTAVINYAYTVVENQSTRQD
jgi:uncharacterized OB-fold protein